MQLINEQELPELEEIAIEILPAVAVFGSYKDEQGKIKRYLASVDYYGANGTNESPESLLPFFDEDDSELPGTNRSTLFNGITAVAVGAGLEDEEDVAMIRLFFQTMSKKETEIEAIRPNENFSTMKEELNAFKHLSEDEKEVATRLQTLGPGKMAKFTIELAVRLVEKRLQEFLDRQKLLEWPEPESPDTVVEAEEQPTEHFVDPHKFRFSCRKCRRILFGEDDMEDPPHSQAKHNFSFRKLGHGGVDTSLCGSFFLKEGISWMGDMSEIEGRVACPRCDGKLGAWHWSGAQCSCGSWVVPAIHIPKSKVDEMNPFQSNLPEGTVISPFARLRASQSSNT